MKPGLNIEDITLYLTQTLTEYEVIPADWGWHIHKGDKYCGHLEYQGRKGWRGRALNYLPAEIREQLTRLGQSSSSMRKAMA